MFLADQRKQEYANVARRSIVRSENSSGQTIPINMPQIRSRSICSCGGSCPKCQSEQKSLQNDYKSRAESAGIMHAGAPEPAPVPTTQAETPQAPIQWIQPQLGYLHKAFLNKECGGFDWLTEWNLKFATTNTNGHIVQKIFMEDKRVSPDSNREPYHKTKVYWEAWKVRQGKIYVKNKPLGIDGWNDDATTGLKGKVTFDGWAKFIPNYDEPLKWGSVEEAGDVPATESQPSAWTNAGTIHRWLKVDFDCTHDDPVEYETRINSSHKFNVKEIRETLPRKMRRMIRERERREERQQKRGRFRTY